MQRLGSLWVLLGLAVVLSSCSRSVELQIGNPCNHPLLLVTSFGDHVDIDERDAETMDRGWLQWALVPARGVAPAGRISDAAGGDHRYSVWVDGAGFRMTVTFDQVKEVDGPIWFDGDACAEENPPTTLVLVEPGDGEDPSLIQMVGPARLVGDVAAEVSAEPDLDVDIETNDQVMVASVWPQSSRDFGQILTPLNDQVPPAMLHVCDRQSCVNSSIGAASRLHLESGDRPASVAERLLGTAIFAAIFGIPALALVVRESRR